MSIIQEIVKTSQLGTSKYVPDISVFPPPLQALLTELKNKTEDSESFFLTSAAILNSYLEAGTRLTSVDYNWTEAPSEGLRQMNSTIAQMIRLFSNDAEQAPLLIFCLQKMKEKQWVLPPELLPEMLDRALHDEELKELLISVAGNRAVWLSNLNSSWKKLFLSEKKFTEEDWLTGSKEERIAYLQFLHTSNHVAAIQLLQQDLSKENASTRAEMLESLLDSVSVQDLPYLESMLQDKSQKVREIVYMLLRTIPESNLVKRYQYWITQGIEVKEERNLVLQKKKKSAIKNFEITENEIFLSGLQKVSSEKGKSDVVYWLEQLASWVPPSWWKEFSGMELHELCKSCIDDKSMKPVLASILDACVLFNDPASALVLMEFFPGENSDAMALLSTEDLLKQLKNCRDDSMRSVLVVLLERTDVEIWPETAVREVLNRLYKYPYALQVREYSMLAIKCPIEFLPILNSFLENVDSKRYEQAYFAARCEQMKRIIEQKERIVELINS